MANMTYAQAVRKVIQEEMRRDEKVFVMGEDVEKLGGVMPDSETLLKFIGPPLQEGFMEHCGYSREKAIEGVRVFRERYLPVGQYENQAAPGIREVLERLKARGYTLALASSKPEELCAVRLHPFPGRRHRQSRRGRLGQGRRHPGGHAPSGADGCGYAGNPDGGRPEV